MALRNQRLVARHRQSENASRTPSSSLGDSDDSSVVVESIEDADVIMGSTADILVINVGTDDEAPTTQSSGSGVSRVKEEHDFQPVRLRVKDEVVLRDNDTMIGDSDEQSSELGVRMNETAMSKPEYEDRVIAMSEQIDSSAEPDQGVDEKKKKEEEEVDVEEVPERLLDKHGHDTALGSYIFDHVAIPRTWKQQDTAILDRFKRHWSIVERDLVIDGAYLGRGRTVEIGTRLEGGKLTARTRRLYFHIDHVTFNSLTDLVLLKGFILRPLQSENDHVDFQPRNLALAVNAVSSSKMSLLDCMDEVSSELVLASAQVRFTNLADARYHTGPQSSSNPNVMTCQYKETIVFLNEDSKRRLLNPQSSKLAYFKAHLEKELKFENITPEDCQFLVGNHFPPGSLTVEDKVDVVDELELRKEWRGTHRASRAQGCPYRVFDICSGGGGASEGARKAGLDVKFALDQCPDALLTYQLNHPNVKLFRMTIQTFIDKLKSGEIDATAIDIDILHLSLPCTWFSPSHTRAGRNDDFVTASFLCVTDILMLLRPRLVTFEQTSGLSTHHGAWMQNMIRQFTEAGFSIHWKLIKLETIAPLPQRRTRLIMFAAAPGEPLPEFPPYTHGPGLKTPATIADAISFIQEEIHTDHRQSRMRQLNKPSYNYYGTFNTITTNGGPGNHHPSGTRELTIRELSCGQSFDLDYRFAGTCTQKRRFIGNAFPPLPAMTIFLCAKKRLEKTDQTERLLLLFRQAIGRMQAQQNSADKDKMDGYLAHNYLPESKRRRLH